MKPLLAKDLETFLDRFDDFKDGEIKDIKIISPTKVLITFTCQDKARGFDWISINLEFNNISDANLIGSEKIRLINLNEGISIINKQNLFAFGIGKCYNISSIKNSLCFLICTNLKYSENLF